MALIRHSNRDPCLPVTGWQLFATPAGVIAEPRELPGQAGWCDAIVPGTVAGTFRQNGIPTPPDGFDSLDCWYRTRLETPLRGRLGFDGLATLCEIWIDGQKRAESRSMFAPLVLEVDLPAGAEILLGFRALTPALAAAPRRSRWRPAMIQPNGLRWFRTTALGAMPGWCPPIRPVGPWRPVTRIDQSAAGLSIPDIADCDIRTRLDGDAGIVDARITLRADTKFTGTIRLTCAEATGERSVTGAGTIGIRLVIPGVERWFPHTHGEPALHALSLDLDDLHLNLGRTGFREITADRGRDGRGFGLLVNGEAIFCRGASWSNADLATLPGERAGYEPWLRQAQAAGMNMVRVSGVMAYETPEFFDLCDELGILVWQDMMLANFDYPQDDTVFVETIRQEAETLLDRTQTAPSLAVLCGGSEVFQQAAMLGAPRDIWSGPVFDTVLPDVIAARRPDIVYVPNSPSGGVLPFVANEGVTHYYGVGAYMRDLDDARRAQVRFASECLAFANVPEEISFASGHPPAIPHHPQWKAAVPRDAGASWDFDDVRDHYLETLYGVSALHLRRDDLERYLTLSRAVTAEVMEATVSEWRRPGSPTRGALVWLLQDLAPGAGWGIIGADGVPKSSWHALARAFRPVQLGLTDEGVNGLSLYMLNERAAPLQARLSLTCWREGAPVVQAERVVDVDPRGMLTLSSFEMLGRFFDITYAYRFGPPGHDVTAAALIDANSGALLAEAFHFPRGRGSDRSEIGLDATIERQGDDWVLTVTTRQFAQSVHVVDEDFLPQANWFHLPPGATRRIALQARKGRPACPPNGEVRAVNGWDRARYGE
jgi:beta-mannosidase